MSDDEKVTDDEKSSGTQRRVYMLPRELVDRVIRFQQELGLASEVETIRRLLDGALKSRDTYETLIERFKERLKLIRDFRDATKEVLVDHPLVTSVAFREDGISFTMKTGISVEIRIDNSVVVRDEEGRRIRYPAPKGRVADMIDDDIPF